MRCRRCGRWVRGLRTRRGPDGRLVFGWCLDCLVEIDLQALGLRSPELPPTEIEPAPGRTTRPERAAGLRTLGLMLVAWGVLLGAVAAAGLAGLIPGDDGFGPAMTHRPKIFAASATILAAIGIAMILAPLDLYARRRLATRGIEVAAIVGATLALVLGIAFHDAKRDPWIVGTVALAIAIAGGARWSLRRR